MKHLSDAENAKLRHGRCPVCGCKRFRSGPEGGGGMDIRCSKCGTEYWWSPPFRSMLLERNEPGLYRRTTWDMVEALGVVGPVTIPPKPKASLWQRLANLFKL